jgi:hypothetical protein
MQSVRSSRVLVSEVENSKSRLILVEVEEVFEVGVGVAMRSRNVGATMSMMDYVDHVCSVIVNNSNSLQDVDFY